MKLPAVARSVLVVLTACAAVSCGRSPPNKDQPLKWNLETLVGDYDRIGRKNPKWDDPARQALTLFAEIRANPSAPSAPGKSYEVTAAAGTAVEAGCDDPLVRYLYLRSRQQRPNAKAAELAPQFEAVADELQRGGYAMIRHFYAAIRTAEMFHAANQQSRDSNAWSKAGVALAGAAQELQMMLPDPQVPAQEIIEASAALMGAAQRRPSFFASLYPPIFSRVFERWPNDPLVREQEGWFYVESAWHARGGGWANAVTDEGWKQFRERLRKAETALLKAWKLDPKSDRVPVLMLRVVLGLQRGRSEMEKWFERAMALNPRNYEACRQKLWYLDPRWYGSAEELIAFGKECVASQKWSGTVPLTLADAHLAVVRYHCQTEAEKRAYWTRPEVWADVKASFDRFFELNPDGDGYHHNYALHAYWSEQWDELNRQLGQLGTVNHEYFGGKEAFDKMVRDAKAHSGK